MTPDELLDAVENEARWLEKLMLKRSKRTNTDVVLAAWMLAGAKGMNAVPADHQRLVLTMVGALESKKKSRIIIPGGRA